MGEAGETQITRLLDAAAHGDSQAATALLPLVYGELRRLAEVRMGKTPPGNTLQPTALVHEAFLRLVGSGDPGWEGRHHFFGAAAQAMRDILVEQARRKSRQKRGAGMRRIEFEVADPGSGVDPDELLVIDEALQRLESEDARAARVVSLRYFGGMTEAETAAIMGVSEATITREWRYARSWLHRALSGDGPAG